MSIGSKGDSRGKLTLDGIVERKNVNSLSVLDVMASMHSSDITELDAEVVTSDCQLREISKSSDFAKLDREIAYPC